MMDESQYESCPITPNTPCFGDRAACRHFGWRRGSTASSGAQDATVVAQATWQ